MTKKATKFFLKTFALFIILGFFTTTGKSLADNLGRLDQEWWTIHPDFNSWYPGIVSPDDEGLVGKLLGSGDRNYSDERTYSPYLNNRTNDNDFSPYTGQRENLGFYGSTMLEIGGIVHITGNILDLDIESVYCYNRSSCAKIFVLDTDYVILSGSLSIGGQYSHNYEFLVIVSKVPGGTTIYTNNSNSFFSKPKLHSIILDNVHLDGGFYSPGQPKTDANKTKNVFIINGSSHTPAAMGNITINNSTISNINGNIIKMEGNPCKFGPIVINNVTTYNNKTTNNYGLFDFRYLIEGNIIFNNLKSFDNLNGTTQYVIYTNKAGVSVNNSYFNPGSNSYDIRAVGVPIAINNIVGSVESTDEINCYVHNIIGSLDSYCNVYGYYKHFDKDPEPSVYEDFYPGYQGRDIDATSNLSGRVPWQGGTEATNLGNLSWNYIINPFSTITNSKYNWLDSSITTTGGAVTRSNGNTSTTSIGSRNYSFGKDLPTQVEPVKWNGNYIVPADLPYSGSQYIASETTKIENLVMEGNANPLVSGEAKIKVKKNGSNYQGAQIFGPYVIGRYPTTGALSNNGYWTDVISFRDPTTAGYKYVLGQINISNQYIHWGKSFNYTGATPPEPPTPTEYCGDGIINQSSEECDPGSSYFWNGCDSNCKLETPSCSSFTVTPAQGTVPLTTTINGTTNARWGRIVHLRFGDGQTTGDGRNGIQGRNGTNHSFQLSHTYNTAGTFYLTGTLINVYNGEIADGVSRPTAYCNTQVTVAPQGSTVGTITINNGATATNNPALTLNLTYNGASKMRFQCLNGTRTSWENVAPTYNFTMTSSNWCYPNMNGEKTIVAQFSGNGISSYDSDSIIYDTIKPSITITDLSATSGGTVTITDNGAGLATMQNMQYIWSVHNNCPTNGSYNTLHLGNAGGINSITKYITSTPTNAGTYYLCINTGVNDNAGNASNCTCSTNYITITNPSTTPIPSCSPAGGCIKSSSYTNCSPASTNGRQLYYKTGIVIVIQGSTLCTNGGIPVPTNGNIQINNANKKITLQYCKNGNGSVVTSYDFTIDDSGPNAPTLSSPANNSSTTQTSVTLQWNQPADIGCNGNIAGYKIQRREVGSSERQSAETSSLTKTLNLSAGTYQWKVQAKDGLGNRGSDSNTRKFEITSTTPPSTPTTPNCSPAGGCFKGSINVSCSVYDRGTIHYTTNGSTPTCSSSIRSNLTQTLNQSNSFYLKLINCINGATSNVATYTFTYDNMGPNAPTLTSPSYNQTITSSSTRLTWNTPTDNGCSSVTEYKIQRRKDGGSRNTVNISNTYYDISNLENGNYERKVQAKDALGNRGEIGESNFKVNLTSSNIDTPDCTESTCFNSNITVSCNSDYQIRYSTNGTPNCTNSSIRSSNHTFSSNTTLNVIACNGLNHSEVKTYNYYKDTTSPDLPVIVQEPEFTQGLSNTIYSNKGNDSGCPVSSNKNDLQYQFCKSTSNSTSNCNYNSNLSSRNLSTGATFSNLTDATKYYYFVRAKDIAGNTSNWSSSTYSTQDNNKPTISFSAQNGAAAPSHSVTVTASDSTSKLSANPKIKYKRTTSSTCGIGGFSDYVALSPATAGSESASVTISTEGLGLPDGEYYLCILANTLSDQVGNYNEAARTSGKFIIQNTPNIPLGVSGTNNSTQRRSGSINITLHVTPTNGRDYAKYSWNTNCQTYGQPFNDGDQIIDSTEGTRILYLCAKKGTETAAWSGIYKLDSTPPTGHFIGVPATCVSESVVVTITGNDNTSGLPTRYISRNGQTWTNVDTQTVLAGSTITSYIRDNAGNTTEITATIEQCPDPSNFNVNIFPTACTNSDVTATVIGPTGYVEKYRWFRSINATIYNYQSVSENKNNSQVEMLLNNGTHITLPISINNIDKIGPDIIATPQTQEITECSTGTINFTIQDTGCGSGNISLKIGNFDTSIHYSGAYTHNQFMDNTGTHTIYFTGSDSVNNKTVGNVFIIVKNIAITGQNFKSELVNIGGNNYKSTGNRKELSHANAGVCEESNIKITNANCNTGTFTTGSNNMFTYTYNGTNTNDLHCNLTITDGDSTIQIVGRFVDCETNPDQCRPTLGPKFISGEKYIKYDDKANIYQKYTSGSKVTIEINGEATSRITHYKYSCIPQDYYCGLNGLKNRTYCQSNSSLPLCSVLTNILSRNNLTAEICKENNIEEARTSWKPYPNSNTFEIDLNDDCHQSDTVPYQSKKQGTRKIWIKIKDANDRESNIVSTDIVNYTTQRPTLELNESIFGGQGNDGINTESFSINITANGAELQNGDIGRNHEIFAPIGTENIITLLGLLRFDAFTGRLITNFK